MASSRAEPHRILRSLGLRATAVGLAFALLFAFGAVDARPDGDAVANAVQHCDTDGDGVPDKIIIVGQCPGGPGDDGPSGPPNGPGKQTITLDTCTYPPGAVADHPWGAPGEESICMGGVCRRAGEEFRHFWERDVVWNNGTPTNPGPWHYAGSRCQAPPEPSVAEVRAFLEQILPKGEVVISPPNGRTLVNWETLFYSPTGDFDRDGLTLGAFRVDVRANAVRYNWNFGDGEKLSTPKQGAEYPKPGSRDVVHKYQRPAADLRVTLSVTYRAEYRINGGPWRDIPGDIPTAAAPGEPLEVVDGLPIIVN